MPENARKLVKIQFYDPDVGYENLWAARLKEKHFRIESIPFFVYGVSLGDIVTAMPDNEGRLQFGKVVQPSGHKTLRARGLMKNAERRKKVIAHLRKLGSDVEVLRSRLLAIDVPSDVSLEAITDFLTNEAKVSWEYGNPENINK
jgi:Domain of unknown function (DUF4265)